MRCASAETLVPVASSAGSRVREIDVATSIDGTRPGKRSGNDVLGGCVSSVDDSRNRPCLAELPLTCRPDVVLGLRIRVSEGRGSGGGARRCECKGLPHRQLQSPGSPARSRHRPCLTDGCCGDRQFLRRVAWSNRRSAGASGTRTTRRQHDIYCGGGFRWYRR